MCRSIPGISLQLHATPIEKRRNDRTTEPILNLIKARNGLKCSDSQGLPWQTRGARVSLRNECGQDFQGINDAQTRPPGNSEQVAIVSSQEVASLRCEMLCSVLSVRTLTGFHGEHHAGTRKN